MSYYLYWYLYSNVYHHHKKMQINFECASWQFFMTQIERKWPILLMLSLLNWKWQRLKHPPQLNVHVGLSFFQLRSKSDNKSNVSVSNMSQNVFLIYKNQIVYFPTSMIFSLIRNFLCRNAKELHTNKKVYV